MSLLFSVIEAVGIDGKTEAIYESGCPDEHDLRELLAYECRCDALRQIIAQGGSIHVRHYRFQTGGRDWLAEKDHIALIEAYNKLARWHGEADFIGRDDVKMLDQYSTHYEA